MNTYNKDGRKDGYLEEYWDNGNIKNKGNYINGTKEGYWEHYYNNGNLHYKGNYINTIRQGDWEICKRDSAITKKKYYIL
jgi:antitoxin component YwqK of YwqJK toxin-antitoxin module